MSYNILADHLAHEHAQELYNSSPRYALVSVRPPPGCHCWGLAAGVAAWL